MELDPDGGFKGEPGGGVPAETLRLMTPFEKVLGFEGGDQLIDLGVLPLPLAAETLAATEPGALQHLDAGRPRVPLGQPFGFGNDLPNAGRRRGDVPLPCYLNHRYSSTEPCPSVGILYGVANQSQAEQFDQLYGRLWRVLLKADTEDLSQHERQLLHHVPAEKGIPLGVVARHLGMPKSSASEQVKSLSRRGFLTRHRDPEDERQLSIVLTDTGVARVRQDSVLDLVRLAAALKKVSVEDRRALLTGLARLAAAADG